MPYYGQINDEIYQQALRLRGDDDNCWEETIPLASTPGVLGSEHPEEMDGDSVIEIWEQARSEAENELGDSNFTLTITIRLEESANAIEGEYVWEKHVKVGQ